MSRSQVTFFTFHRFSCPDLGVAGHDAAELRRALARMRRERYHVLDITEAVRRLQNGAALSERAVVFTVDDGYADFASAGAPAFAEFDAPVTVFVTTGFVDGTVWHWWDQIMFIARHAPAMTATLHFDDVEYTISFDAAMQRADAAQKFAEFCTRIPERTKNGLIDELSRTAEVPIPAQPPAEFAPMSWDQVRQLQRRGVSFGPHTVTHPVLIRTQEEQARREIHGSWNAIRRELPDAVPVFAYPNGDYGEREIRLVQEVGLRAALAATPGYATSDAARHSDDGLFRIPRFPYPDDADSTCLTASGFSRIVDPARRLARRASALDLP